jgi:hypothetical protein
MHLSYNQLIPIAADTHAAGANTKSKRIITEAKYTDKTVYIPINTMLLDLLL